MIHTPVIKMTVLLLTLSVLSSTVLYFAERGVEGTTITSYGRALYWGIVALSTAGIADMPTGGFGQLVGGVGRYGEFHGRSCLAYKVPWFLW